MSYEAKLGDRVKDQVSGFEGVVTVLHQYLQGSDRMTVQPPVLESGVLPAIESFDAPNLEVTLMSKSAVSPTNRDRGITDDLELGDRVRDRVSGLEGIAIARHIFLSGCDRVSVQPAANRKKGTLPEPQTFDAPNLEILKRAAVSYKEPVEERRKIGGPAKFMPGKKPEGTRPHSLLKR